MRFQLNVNGQSREVEVEEDTPLLWVLREDLALTGVRFGCGAGQCGACTVLLDGEAIRSCVTPVEAAKDVAVTTIEGLGGNHPVQQAWVEENAPQCGYCQSGQVMSAVALLRVQPKPTDADIDLAMSGNICRCGTYPRIKKAIKNAALKMAPSAEPPAVSSNQGVKP